MAGTKTQHYVPRFYLRHSANSDGKLIAYRRKEDKYFNPTPENVCAENYLYEVRHNSFDVNPAITHNYIEDRLASAEGRLRPLYDQLINCCNDRSFVGEEFLKGRLAACLLAANLLVRHPLILEDERRKAGYIANKVLFEGEITQQEQLVLTQVGLVNDLEGVAEIAIMQTALFSSDPEIAFSSLYHSLATKKMSIIQAPVGMGFITTCMPLDFVGVNESNNEFTEAYMPLSSKFAAHFTDNTSEHDIGKATLKQVVRYNTALLVRGALWSTAMAGTKVALETAVQNWKALQQP